VATDGSRNSCSLLYAAAWNAAKALGYRRLVTYTQTGVLSPVRDCCHGVGSPDVARSAGSGRQHRTLMKFSNGAGSKIQSVVG
jgi:hypothetical protein